VKIEGTNFASNAQHKKNSLCEAPQLSANKLNYRLENHSVTASFSNTITLQVTTISSTKHMMQM
jgi:hypothetical protein